LLTHPSPSLPLLASPSYLPLVPHFPPSRAQTTTRDSVGFRISKCICAAAEPTELSVCGHITPRQVRNSVVVPWSWLICLKAAIRRETSETSEAVFQELACPRGKFFLRYPISGSTQPKWGTTILCAVRRAAPRRRTRFLPLLAALPLKLCI
jgi:hypothetical protein